MKCCKKPLLRFSKILFDRFHRVRARERERERKRGKKKKVFSPSVEVIIIEIT